jgi:hypothetical protein
MSWPDGNYLLKERIMAGCYGNSPEDRHFSRLLDIYLGEGEEDEDGLEEEEEGDDEAVTQAWLVEQLPNDIGE